MVDQAGCYYGAPFKGPRGVPQVDPLSPAIFNMVVYALIIHWDIVVIVEEAGPEGFERLLQMLAILVYMCYRLLSSPFPSMLQEALDVLTVLFYRV